MQSFNLAAALAVTTSALSHTLADRMPVYNSEPSEDYFGHDLPSIDVNDFIVDTFDNLVDHYNMQDDRTYKQRYWYNDKYFEAGDKKGPIFIYICGEYRCSVPETRLYPFMLGA